MQAVLSLNRSADLSHYVGVVRIGRSGRVEDDGYDGSQCLGVVVWTGAGSAM
jgi:hypothetical protein